MSTLWGLQTGMAYFGLGMMLVMSVPVATKHEYQWNKVRRGVVRRILNLNLLYPCNSFLRLNDFVFLLSAVVFLTHYFGERDRPVGFQTFEFPLNSHFEGHKWLES
jgi:hypothetical protein